MNILPLLIFALVMLVGFAAHRASLCAVRAVDEILSAGSAHMLASFARAAAWTAAVAGALLLFVPGTGSPALAQAAPALGLAGGFLFGVGAAINGGCSLSTLQRLVEGDLGMLATLAALLAGVVAWTALAPGIAPGGLHPMESIWARGDTAQSLLVLLALWLWAAWELWRIWKTSPEGSSLASRFASHRYRPSSAAALLGIAGGLLYTLQGAWTYTNFLRVEAASWFGTAHPASAFHALLFAALLAGMFASARQRGAFRLQFGGFARTLRHGVGGFVMGVGAAIIPGGNDTLTLAAIPTLSPWAFATYFAMLAGVALSLAAMRLALGPMPRTDCRGDGCA